MDGQCNWKDIVLEAEVCLENQARGEGMLYLGQASGPWKLRYNNHTKAFRNRSQRAHCELANHVWDLKDREKKHLGYSGGWCLRKPPTARSQEDANYAQGKKLR